MYYECTVTGVVLFILGLWGVILNKSNLMIILMSIELMLLAVSLLFTINSVYLENIVGQIFVIMIIAIAAAESSIGLAILIAYYRLRGTIAVKSLNFLKG